MSHPSPKFPALLLTLFTALAALGADRDTIDLPLLQQVDPTLRGTGIPVAQPEGPEGGVTGAFEVNPYIIVGQPTNSFTWISSLGMATNYPNAVGTNSVHAASVAANFYDPTIGPAPGVSHIDNYDANYFYNNYIVNELAISARVVNQSFNFSDSSGNHLSTNDEQLLDSQYDDYAAHYKTLFVSGAGNNASLRVFPPATCYNGIGVGVDPGNSCTGTTPDGRSKPDITSPGSLATSFSTPFVSGSAAVLMQAGLRGDGGPDTNSANDLRTIKALLLNGAVKPADWTNGVTTPLDARYGAGVLNVFNSWNQLKGGKHPFIESTSVTSGNPHPPGTNTNNEPVLVGWDFNSLTNSNSSHDRISHYYFNLPGSNSFTLTSTLVWLRPHSVSPGQLMGINDLNLFLYNTANSNLVLCSTSAVDNVEHLFVPSLPVGRYDLQVQKNPHGQVSSNETYALVFEFFNLSLSIAQTNTNAVISWPLAPSGFELQAATNLSPPVVWSPVATPASVDTNASEDVVVVPVSSTNQFFRLQRP